MKIDELPDLDSSVGLAERAALVETLKANEGTPKWGSDGEAKLNEGIVVDEIEASIDRMGQTLYTSKYPA